MSLDQRIRNIDKVFLDFKSMKEQIDKDHINLMNQGKSLKRINPTINMLKRKYLSKSDGKNTSNNIEKPVGISQTCPICGNTWKFRGKPMIRRGKEFIQCSRCRKYFEKVKDDN